MISIIVPIYNVENYLDSCISSILRSSYRDLEVILVDDGSTDCSGKICDKYGTIDVRCKILHTPNRGLSAARNYGMSYAKGDYISFVDGDDFVHPQMFEFLFRALEENPNADFSFCPFYSYHVDDNLITEVFYYSDISNQKIGRSQMVNRMFGTWKLNGVIYIVAWNKLYRSKLLQDLQFAACPISEDLIFNTEVSLRMNQAILVNVPLYYYVQRSGSIIHQGVTKKYIDQIDVYDTCYNLLKKESPELRNVCLQKCVKTNLNILCESRGSDLYGYAKERSKLYLSAYRSDLFNSSLPFFKKMSLIIISYFPHLYQKIAIKIASLSPRK